MSTETISPPICEKHGCEKVWRPRKNHKKGGVRVCRECHRLASRKWVLKNADQHAATCARYYANNTESCKARNDDWAKANPDKCQAKDRRYKEKHPGRKAETKRQWRKENPLRDQATAQRRLALKQAAIVPGRPVTDDVIAKRFALFKGCCFCSADRKLTLEHMVPLSKGGLHVEENLLGSCLSCNSGKKDRPVEAWFRKQSFFSEQRWQEIQEVCQ